MIPRSDIDELMTHVDDHIASRLSATNTGVTAATNRLRIFKVEDYRAAGETSADDYKAFMRMHDVLNYGDTIVIDAPLKFATPIVITKAINLICVGSSAYFWPDLTTAQDAITFRPVAGQQHVDWNINVYGLANCCQNAVVIDGGTTKGERSRYRFDIQAGAAAYAVKVLGCLISDFNINITDNYNPPLTNAGVAVDNIYIGASGGISTNACRFLVNLESGRHGIVQTSMGGGQGNNTFSGTIEGLSGRPLDITGGYHFDIKNLHLEDNVQDSLLTNCAGFHIGPAVANYKAPDSASHSVTFSLVGCNTFVIDGYAGGLDIDADSYAGQLGMIWVERATPPGTQPTVVNASSSVRARGMIRDTGASATLLRTPGDYSLENIFHNPYMDIWTNGIAAAPDGWSGSNVTWARNTGTTYSRNPIRGAGAGVSARARTTATAVANGPVATPLTQFETMPAERWVSFVMPVLVPTGINDLRAYVWSSATGLHHLGTIVTEKDTWVEVRGSIKLSAGKSVRIWPRFYNTAAAQYTTGTCYIGGLSIVNGPIQPQYLADHGRRSEYIVNSVTHTAAFVGQRALVGGALYMASGTSAASDWDAI